jgi:hypothetical protein
MSSGRRRALARRHRYNSMSHIAINNMVGGKNVRWVEQVGDEQYLK